jgi:hypothetical protein
VCGCLRLCLCVCVRDGHLHVLSLCVCVCVLYVCVCSCGCAVVFRRSQTCLASRSMRHSDASHSYATAYLTFWDAMKLILNLVRCSCFLTLVSSLCVCMCECVCVQRPGFSASVWLRLARLPPPASRVRRSRRLLDTLAAAPGLLAHAFSETVNSHPVG